MLYYTFAKNAPVFVPYFMVGVGSAAALESVHYAFWEYNHRRSAAAKTDKQPKPDGVVGFVNRVLHYSEPHAAPWPWVHDSPVLGLVFPSAHEVGGAHVAPGASRGHDGGAERGPHFSLLKSDDARSEDDGSCDDSLPADAAPGPAGPPGAWSAVRVAHYLWRFFPDALAAFVSVLMAPIKVRLVFLKVTPPPSLSHHAPSLTSRKDSWMWDWQGWNIYVGMPALYMALIFVLMLQKGSARYNLSRLILESRPVTTMGYSSYALYLFQRIVFTFYLPLIYIGTLRGFRYGMDIGDGDPWRGGPWFEQLPNGVKFLAVVGLTLMAWLTQKHFQDRLVTWAYSKCLAVGP
jgi:hypothetical protein